MAADQTGSHGALPDALFLDELHVQSEEFAANMLDNAGKKSSTGLAVVTTNAGFTGTWQWRWREIARTSPRWAFLETTTPPPWVSQQELDEARRRNSRARFLRLWAGVWGSGSGDAIDVEDIEAARYTGRPIEGRVLGMGMGAGLDIGVKRDFSAFVPVGCHADTNRLHALGCKVWKPKPSTGKVDIEEIEEEILAAHRLYRFHAVKYDPHQAAYLAERLEKQGVPMQEFTFAGKNLDLLASTLMEHFAGRNISLLDDPQLIESVGKLSIVDKSFGHKLEASRDKESGHGDAGIALALGCIAALEAPAYAGTWDPISSIRSNYGEPRRSGWAKVGKPQSDAAPPRWT